MDYTRRRSKLIDAIGNARAALVGGRERHSVELHLVQVRRGDVPVIAGGVWVYETFRPTSEADHEAARTAGGAENLMECLGPSYQGVDLLRDNPGMFIDPWLEHITRRQPEGVTARVVVKDLHISMGWDRAECADISVVRTGGAKTVRDAYALFQRDFSWDRVNRVIARTAGRPFRTPATIGGT